MPRDYGKQRQLDLWAGIFLWVMGYCLIVGVAVTLWFAAQGVIWAVTHL